jgi:hypothetical protein
VVSAADPSRSLILVSYTGAANFLSSSSSFMLTRAEWTPFQIHCHLCVGLFPPVTARCSICGVESQPDVRHSLCCLCVGLFPPVTARCNICGVESQPDVRHSLCRLCVGLFPPVTGRCSICGVESQLDVRHSLCCLCVDPPVSCFSSASTSDG